jgi:ribosome maturation factor RimP
VLLLTPRHSSAQTEADDIRTRVKERQKVSITDDQGREVNGRITTIAGDTLTLTPDRAPRVVVPYAQIVRIVALMTRSPPVR